MDCTMRIAKTKALISCAVMAKRRFSHNEAHFMSGVRGPTCARVCVRAYMC